MKRMAVCIAVLLVSSLAWAGSKTYQATGPVVEVRDDAIVVDKGKEGKWEIARDANTKGERYHTEGREGHGVLPYAGDGDRGERGRQAYEAVMMCISAQPTTEERLPRLWA